MKAARRKSTVAGAKRTRAAVPAVAGQPKLRTVALAPAAPSSGGASPPGAATGHWTYLTNHSHVLILLSRNPSLVLREVALQVGITERAVQRIIADLESAGVIQREKVGRQNHYRIRAKQRLRHTIESHCTIGELLALINGE